MEVVSNTNCRIKTDEKVKLHVDAAHWCSPKCMSSGHQANRVKHFSKFHHMFSYLVHEPVFADSMENCLPSIDQQVDLLTVIHCCRNQVSEMLKMHLTFLPKIWLIAADSFNEQSSITLCLIVFIKIMKALSGFLT